MKLRKFQIFISSTYIDLQDERNKVENAIRLMGHFPDGMELFNASNESQWDIIKQTIDSSDYYVLIVANRYGSICPESDISYTQKEYQYAKDNGIPILIFMKSEFINDESDNFDLLSKFRQELLNSGRVVSWWENSTDLISKVMASLSKAFNKKVSIGWERNLFSMRTCSIKDFSTENLINSISQDSIILYGKELKNHAQIDMNVQITNHGIFADFYLIERQSGIISAIGVIDNNGQNFFYDIRGDECFDKDGEILDEYAIQILCIDIDDDGKKEVLVSIGEIGFVRQILIYTYVENDSNPFKLIGTINPYGSCNIELDGTISMVAGSARVVTSYLCRNKKLWQEKSDDIEGDLKINY